jgi:hypothetical protein
MTITPEDLKPTLVERITAPIKRLADGMNRKAGRMTSDEFYAAHLNHYNLIGELRGTDAREAAAHVNIIVNRVTGSADIRMKFAERKDAESYAEAARMTLDKYTADFITLKPSTTR